MIGKVVSFILGIIVGILFGTYLLSLVQILINKLSS